MNSLSERLDLILSRMSLNLPFIAAVAMSMQVKIEKCGTAETNGVWIRFDPDFAAKQRDDELAFLYAHETLHKAFMHPWRRQSRKPDLWNMACDHVINLSLIDVGMKMPKGGLADRRFSGMSEEAVYERLVQEGAKAPEGYSVDLIEDDEKSQADAEIEVINIAKACAMAGTKSAMLDKILENAGKSAVRWQDVLRTFVSSTVRSGSTWKRPSRRSAGLGVYLPDLRSKQIGSTVVFADVSGSMVPLLQEITSELQGIIDEASPEFTHVVCGDTRVTHVETFGRGASVKLQCKGGGGTDFRPMFAEVDKQGWQPDCAVFLTDTEGTFPNAPPDYPVIWAVLGTSGGSVPWGEMLRVRAR